MASTDFQAVAVQFVEYYYKTFDAGRAGLAPLYRPNSMLTWEGSPFQGTEAILEKLTSLPFGNIKHQVSTQDAQPSSDSGGIIVMVTGALQLEGEDRPLNYTQTFQLLPDAGGYYVYNDVFRLLLG